MSGVLELQTTYEHVSLARVRLELLFDAGTFHPLRSEVADGVVCGSGRVNGRPVCAWAQDGGFKGGSLGVAGGETIAATIRRADKLGCPVVGFPHSAGARLQQGTGALTAYGTIFHAQSNSRVPQISVIGGPCAGGGAYSPALGDIVILAGERARMFLTGPKVVEAAIGEEISSRDLGGTRVHMHNGVAHLLAVDDVDAARLTREVLAHLPSVIGGPLPLAPPLDPVRGNPAAVIPPTREGTQADGRPFPKPFYDIRHLALHLLDGGELLELSDRWARNLVVGFARIDGRPIGVIANQPRVLGGCLDAEASEKGAWFINLCNRFGIPLLVLVDTPGFLPGSVQENAGVIRKGASLVRAFASASIPRITLTVRQAYGGAHIAMNSRALGATLTLAWPTTKIGIMGATQAKQILGQEVPDDPAQLAASEGHVDEVIEPMRTRARLVHELDMVCQR
jgi:acetyl-CoA carboxylase carboxyltransferase component